jgi:ATP-dependent DNA ligase
VKTRTHFAFRIDVWDERGGGIVEHVAGVEDFEAAVATYWADRGVSLARLRSRSCIIDGEAVACDESGVPSFERIRHGLHDESVFLYAFRPNRAKRRRPASRPARRRKATLAMILAKAGVGIRFNEHIEDDGATVFRHA